MARTTQSRDEWLGESQADSLPEAWAAELRTCGETAARALASHARANDVHALRQTFKRARALLRLADSAKIARAQPLRRAMARTAKHCSALRDATIAARLAAKFADDLDGEEQAAAILLAEIPEPRPKAAWWAARRLEVARIVRDLAQVGRAKVTGRDVTDGLRVSVRRVFRRAKYARADGGIESAHEWRKRAIDLREQVSFLQPWLPPSATEAHRGLEKLARRLGRATDCRAFLALVRKQPWPEKLTVASRRLEKFARHCQRRALKRADKCWKKLRRKLRLARWHVLARFPS